jgi:hypothetical protein
MVVAKFDIICIAVLPDEAYAPLIVDTDGMLAGPAALQSFKTIAWRNTQIIKAYRSVECHQLPSSPLNDIRREMAGSASQEKAFSLLVAKANDHPISVSENDTDINTSSLG